MTEWMNRCHFGDCLDTLRRMPDAFVHCGISSPPYYGLRDYGVPPTDWPAMEYRTLGGVVQVPAMSCCLGLEPTPEAFIGHIVLIYREVRRVLRDDGVCWVNMGDSYCSTAPGTRNAPQTKGSTTEPEAWANVRPDTPDGMKPKDLMGIPWMMAFALRYDGWYLRQGVIWSKPNSMPESVTDRCTKAHEDIFLLSKSPRYWFDHEAIKEPANLTGKGNANGFRGGAYVNNATFDNSEGGKRTQTGNVGARSARDSFKRDFSTKQRKQNSTNESFVPNSSPHGGLHREGSEREPESRNKRSVWTVATKPYKGAHFATYPEELVEPMVLAGCPPGGIVLDQFFGSGTTGAVAQRLGRQWIGCELNTAYKPLQDERLAGTLGLVLETT